MHSQIKYVDIWELRKNMEGTKWTVEFKAPASVDNY